MSLFKLDKNVKIKGIDFSSIGIEDKELYQSYWEKISYNKDIWAMNFVYTIEFNESNTRKVFYKIIDDMFCVFVTKDDLSGMFMLYPPMGECDRKKFNVVTLKCFKIMLKVNEGNYDACNIRTIHDDHVALLNKKYFKCKKTGFGFEHLYGCKEVAETKGKSFEYIRRKLNKFKRECPTAVWRRYTDGDWYSMMALKKAWEETAGEKYFRIIDASYYMGTIKRHKEINHDVFVVELNNRIIGMISGGYLDKNQTKAWCFLRKPLNNFDGLSEYLIWALCNEYKDKAVTLNDGGDGGTQGLRFFKERFQPVRSNRMYECTLNKDVFKSKE